MSYLQLFWEFFKTGLFAVGGGMATIPFLYNMSDKTGWFTHQDLANMIAVGESTPGPIGVNMATYVGYVTGMAQGGIGNAIAGAVIATLGLVLPSLGVILIVAAMLNRFKDSPLVQNDADKCSVHQSCAAPQNNRQTPSGRTRGHSSACSRPMAPKHRTSLHADLCGSARPMCGTSLKCGP